MEHNRSEDVLILRLRDPVVVVSQGHDDQELWMNGVKQCKASGSEYVNNLNKLVILDSRELRVICANFALLI